ncbi:FAD-linked oxidoreductase-like protein [Catenaria anguillulae PL171]|uniref:Proline dehydrogenase n=1 Tax=Catenaria anguillulae PL171 TaxID=765915 RepID=A0A1Y2HRK9_9FUNG|nr:FAD-linked oxidoreductase-like protein [Catenaria anguillulae PL171]
MYRALAGLRAAPAHALRLRPSPAISRSFTTQAPPKTSRSLLRTSARYLTLATAGTALIGGTALTLQLALADPDALSREILKSVPSDPLYAKCDPRAPFRSKSTLAVLRSWVVFKLCDCALLVDSAPQLLQLADTLHMSWLAHWIVKHTFFAHFCGGESLDELGEVMAALKSNGIGSILDISIEADLEAGQADADPVEVRAREEVEADHAAQLFAASINAAGNHPGTCIAVKVTALGPTPVLLSVSSAIARAHRMLGAGVTRDQWLASVPGGAALFDAMTSAKTTSRSGGTATSADLVSLLARDPSPAYLAMLGVPAEDVASYAKLLDRLRALCAQAKDKGVGLMVDAEQTYFQPAIDTAALAMGKAFNGSNGGAPVVFNTYQLYLKDALGRLKRDLAMSEEQGWHFAAKLVRGAYMVSERAKAKAESYPSPINDTLESTHASYNAGVDAVLARIARGTNPSATVIVASHNRDSVVRTTREMRHLGVDKSSGRVLFGQLMGMHDLTSYALAENGYPIYKYLPYGPVHEVVPYLLRRAQENSAVLGGAAGKVDKQILWHELVCRFQGK